MCLFFGVGPNETAVLLVGVPFDTAKKKGTLGKRHTHSLMFAAWQINAPTEGCFSQATCDGLTSFRAQAAQFGCLRIVKNGVNCNSLQVC